MADNEGPIEPLAIMFAQQLRDQWIRDINDALAKIDPYLTRGRLSPKSLPPGVMRDTGDYDAGNTYRKGDLVQDGGSTYVAKLASTGQATSDATYWTPLGGGGGGGSIEVMEIDGTPDIPILSILRFANSWLTDDGGGQGTVNPTLDKIATAAADVALGSHKLTGVSDPTSAQDAATKAYVDVAVNPLDWKQSVRVVATTNGTLASAYANGQTVDGVTLATGDRILLAGQTTGSQNGIYVVAASGAPTRAADADVSAEVTSGLVVPVAEGTANADKLYMLTTNDPITLGTTALTFVQYAFGNPMTTAGDTIVGGANGLPTRKAIGAAGQYAEVNSGATDLTYVYPLSTVAIVIGNGIDVIAAGVKISVECPFAGYIEQWTLVADVAGSIVLDVWRDTYANYPPTVADTITASAKPTLSSAQTAQDATLTGWTRTFAQGDWLRVNVDSASGLTAATLSLRVRRTA